MEFPYIKVFDFPKHQKRKRILPWIRFGIFSPKEDGSKNKPITYSDFVAFTYQKFPASMPQQTAILGTIGFFKQVDVTFQYPKRILVRPKEL